MAALKQLRDVVVLFFAALMAAGAFYAALEGLVKGAVFCLLCKRGSAAAPFSQTPVLFVISELMLIGLGALCAAGFVYGLRDLRRKRPEGADDEPIASRGKRPVAPRQFGDAEPASAALRKQRRQPERAAAATNATALAAPPVAPADHTWMAPSRQPAPSPLSPWAGLVVHVLAAMCMLATLALGALALTYHSDSSDLSFAPLILAVLPFSTLFLGCVFLALSPRPGVSRVGLRLVLTMLGAAVVLGLAEKLFGPVSPGR